MTSFRYCLPIHIPRSSNSPKIVALSIRMMFEIVKTQLIYFVFIKICLTHYRGKLIEEDMIMEKPERNTADLLVECLIEEGVEYIFGIPGEENLALMNAIYDSPIKFITVRHEQGAAFMADVYGRLTGKAGVWFTTLGPGATNLITGVADAYSDGAPLVAITGQVGTELNKLYQPEVEVVGDISDSLLQIGRRTARHQEPEKALEIKARMVAEHEATPAMLHSR